MLLRALIAAVVLAPSCVLVVPSTASAQFDQAGSQVNGSVERASLTDAAAAAAQVGARAARPGAGAWADYDFVPGERVLFYDDFSNDTVGDFPRRWDLAAGNWEIVNWEGGRYLRAPRTVRWCGRAPSQPVPHRSGADGPGTETRGVPKDFWSRRSDLNR